MKQLEVVYRTKELIECLVEVEKDWKFQENYKRKWEDLKLHMNEEKRRIIWI